MCYWLSQRVPILWCCVIYALVNCISKFSLSLRFLYSSDSLAFLSIQLSGIVSSLNHLKPLAVAHSACDLLVPSFLRLAPGIGAEGFANKKTSSVFLGRFFFTHTYLLYSWKSQKRPLDSSSMVFLPIFLTKSGSYLCSIT